jgi:hypothetical protein
MRTNLARLATVVALVAVTGLVVLSPDADSRGSEPRLYENYMETLDVGGRSSVTVIGPIRKQDKIAISSITWSSYSGESDLAFATLIAENSSASNECGGSARDYEVGFALVPNMTVHLAYPKRLVLGSPNIDERAEGSGGEDAPFWCLKVLNGGVREVTIVG